MYIYVYIAGRNHPAHIYRYVYIYITVSITHGLSGRKLLLPGKEIAPRVIQPDGKGVAVAGLREIFGQTQSAIIRP